MRADQWQWFEIINLPGVARNEIKLVLEAVPNMMGFLTSGPAGKGMVIEWPTEVPVQIKRSGSRKDKKQKYFKWEGLLPQADCERVIKMASRHPFVKIKGKGNGKLVQEEGGRMIQEALHYLLNKD